MHPVLFELPTPWGPQPIYAYGVMLGVSLIVGWQILMALGKRAGLGANLLGDLYLTAAISGLVGARALYVFVNREEFTSVGQWFDLRGGGLVAYGGFLGGFVGTAVHARLKHVSLLRVGDAATPAIALGLFFTRLGCYLYGCDFGTRLPESAPEWFARLGRFPQWDDSELGLRGSPAFLHHVDAYGLARDASRSFAVHPVQLYEALLGLLLAAAAFALLRRQRFEGQILLAFASAYGVARFLLEYVRDDPERGNVVGFSTSQFISLLVVPAAAIGYSVLRRKARAEPHFEGSTT
ncbi:MAG TPA: prolipoprotein diacylglyceryl transferase family protein [Polyangiales bacterium]|nr:prolipoprotein diacylglyceryl transferase family protein [Polyangiales bacterium]